MRHERRIHRRGGAALAVALLLGAAGSLASAPRAVAGVEAAETRLAAESAALKARLEAKTAEISALKRNPTGVRGDYELRQRMAEANELARQLTALENQLRGAAPAPAPATAPNVEAPAALEARADVLSDEARKLAAKAESMSKVAGQLRTRQALRRRATTVERDPFAALDASKRVVLVRGTASTLSAGPDKATVPGSPKSNTAETAGGSPGAATTGQATGNGTTVAGNNTAGAGQGSGSSTTAPGVTSGTATAGSAPAGGSSTPPAGGSSTPPAGGAPTPSTGGGSSAPVSGAPAVAPMTPPTGTGNPSGAPPTAVAPPSTQQPTSSPASDSSGGGSTRGTGTTATPTPAGSNVTTSVLIDPALQAELQRIAAGGAPAANDAEAFERAAAALTNRARVLEEQAKQLRARAATR